MISMIAIDGPAASGKSTLAQLMAKDLDYLFFDTGVMYRAITLLVLEANTPVDDEAACVKLAQQSQIDVLPPSEQDGRANDIVVNGADKTWDIRLPEVDKNVSVVASYMGVREVMAQQQRRIGLRGRVVMVGRDIGTVVLPEADLKIYLDASVEERAQRRYDECVRRGDEVTYAEVLADMQRRDEIDSSRDVAPLRPAEDAVIIDSDGQTIEQILDQATALIHKPVE